MEWPEGAGGIALKGKKPADINVTGGILGEFAQQGLVLHRQIRRTMCHPTRRKKALSLTLSENTSKGDGAFSCIFQSHLADSRTGFTRSVCSYPPIPI